MTWQPQTCPLFLLVESITNKNTPIQNSKHSGGGRDNRTLIVSNISYDIAG